MSDRRDPPDEPEAALAAEFAAGLLEGADLGFARQRAATDPTFAHEVARWRGRLSALNDEVADVAPPANVWQRIERAIDQSNAANDNFGAMRRTVALWRLATAGMTAVAAALALILLIQPRPRTVTPPSSQVPVAQPLIALVGDEKATTLMVSWDPADRQLVFAAPGKLATDAKHSHELWVIPAGGTPRSLGVLPAGKLSHKRLADALATLLQQGATIAVSVEPRGGSPTGSPTGPVIASGSLSRV